MNIFEEALLEPIFRYWRFTKVIGYIEKNKKIVLADLGCGPHLRFFEFAKKKNIFFQEYIGFDPLINPIYQNSKCLRLINEPLTKKIPLSDDSVDFITALAFLEHIDNPEDILKDSIRVLKKGGKGIFTTPSWKAKALLEFLSFKIGIISRREIEEHKRYFNKQDILKILKNEKEIKITHEYFEFGYNNILVIEKK